MSGYVFYLPSTTAIDLDGARSCTDFAAYHNSMTVASQSFPYAVISECNPLESLTLLDSTTLLASREVVGSVTDGTQGETGFYLDLTAPATWGWEDILGGEISQLCVDEFGLGQDVSTEGGYTVQRIWSATNASVGKNPCLPVPAGEVYFNTFPSATVLAMDVGGSQTITVTASADGTIAPWTVTAEDWTSPGTSWVSFAIAGGTSGENGPEIQVSAGDTFQLTVTLTDDPSDAPNGEADAVLVSENGTDESATAAHFWPFVVMTPAEASAKGFSP